MEEKSKVFTWISRIITILFSVALAAFVIFLGIQLYRSTIFDLYDDIEITDSLKEAYKENSDIRTRPVEKEGLSENGIIKVTELAYIKDENGYSYIQFNVRFNKYHIDEVAELCPELTYDDVEYYLVAKNGGTASNEYKLTEIRRGDKYRYRYFKFEATDIMECDELVLEMRLLGVQKTMDENDEATLIPAPDKSTYHTADTAKIQERNGPSYEYKLSRKEKKSISE